MTPDWKTKTVELSLRELGELYNELCGKINEISANGKPYTLGQLQLWIELEAKQGFIMGVICERGRTLKNQLEVQP